jgi:FkbM family methyltransferase
MIRSLISLSKSPYNKKHFLFAVYRFIYWKLIRLFKLKNIKYKIWGDRKLYLNYDSFQCMWIMYNYIVDWEEFNLIKDYLKDNDNVADVGSNMGYYSIWMSKFISKNGRIHSFEPDSGNFLKLQNNVLLNNASNINLNKLALSDVDGELFFTTGLDGENHISGQATSTTAKIFSKCFDTYAKENSIDHFAYVKVDIEGFEYYFLKGALNLLSAKKIDILQLELNDQIKNSGRSIEEVIEFLNKNDYYLCKYDTAEKKLIPIDYLRERDNYFVVSDLAKINTRLQTINPEQHS